MTDTIHDKVAQIIRDQPVPCVLPWTQLEERPLAREYRHCCWSLTSLGRIDEDAGFDGTTPWNSKVLRDTRRSMIEGTHGEHCPASCPVLNWRHEPAKDMFYQYDPSEYDTFSVAFRSNREKVVSSILEGRPDSATWPLRLRFFPSTACNLDCLVCYLKKQPSVARSSAYYTNAFELLPYLEGITIYGGEPFACKLTREILFGTEMLKHPHIHVSTVTNGTLLDGMVLDRLKALRLGWFEFSLDACTKQTYERTRPNAQWHTTCANLGRFARARDHGELRVYRTYASFVIQKTNFHEIAQFIDFVNDYGIIPVFCLVFDSTELRNSLNQVRGAVEKGLAKGHAIVNSAAVRNLRYIPGELPEYGKHVKWEHRKQVILSALQIFGPDIRSPIERVLVGNPKVKRLLKKVVW